MFLKKFITSLFLLLVATGTQAQTYFATHYLGFTSSAQCATQDVPEDTDFHRYVYLYNAGLTPFHSEHQITKIVFRIRFDYSLFNMMAVLDVQPGSGIPSNWTMTYGTANGCTQSGYGGGLTERTVTFEKGAYGSVFNATGFTQIADVTFRTYNDGTNTQFAAQGNVKFETYYSDTCLCKLDYWTDYEPGMGTDYSTSLTATGDPCLSSYNPANDLSPFFVQGMQVRILDVTWQNGDVCRPPCLSEKPASVLPTWGKIKGLYR